MSGLSRVSSVLAYIPVIGWLFVFLIERKNAAAMFHLRQSIGLFLFLVAVFLGWAVIAWLVAWIPYMAVFSVATFTVVMAAYFVGAVTWVMGLLNALRNRLEPLPLYGRWASRLPIR
jgi:uncharacterized membrane protein